MCVAGDLFNWARACARARGIERPSGADGSATANSPRASQHYRFHIHFHLRFHIHIHIHPPSSHIQTSQRYLSHTMPACHLRRPAVAASDDERVVMNMPLYPGCAPWRLGGLSDEGALELGCPEAAPEAWSDAWQLGQGRPPHQGGVDEHAAYCAKMGFEWVRVPGPKLPEREYAAHEIVWWMPVRLEGAWKGIQEPQGRLEAAVSVAREPAAMIRVSLQSVFSGQRWHDQVAEVSESAIYYKDNHLRLIHEGHEYKSFEPSFNVWRRRAGEDEIHPDDLEALGLPEASAPQ